MISMISDLVSDVDTSRRNFDTRQILFRRVPVDNASLVRIFDRQPCLPVTNMPCAPAIINSLYEVDNVLVRKAAVCRGLKKGVVVFLLCAIVAYVLMKRAPKKIQLAIMGVGGVALVSWPLLARCAADKTWRSQQRALQLLSAQGFSRADAITAVQTNQLSSSRSSAVTTGAVILAATILLKSLLEKLR
jgi:hypothetical protein